MCYSARVKQAQHEFYKRFGATIDPSARMQYQNLIAFEKDVGPDEIKKLMGLARKPSSSQFKEAGEDERIYPNYFAPVIIWEDGQRKFVPMRYRVRPAGMPKEIPSKYNVFNARIDSLETRQTWKKLFGQKHALFPFVSFYEWVNRDGKKAQINFLPGDRQVMWAPALYDEWSSYNGEITFKSFAMITDEPPPEVEAAGHDRSPIFIHENYIDQWLQPEGKSRAELYTLLGAREAVIYGNQWVDAA